jgi:hypothetical protein
MSSDRVVVNISSRARGTHRRQEAARLNIITNLLSQIPYVPSKRKTIRLSAPARHTGPRGWSARSPSSTGLPFVCVSAGTRNHGLNRDDPRESM